MTNETKVKTNWLPEDEQGFYDTCVHGLRMKGWSRIDAEDEALARIEARRAKSRRL